MSAMTVTPSTTRRAALVALLVVLFAHTSFTYSFYPSPQRGAMRSRGMDEPRHGLFTPMHAAASSDDVNSSPAPLPAAATAAMSRSAAVPAPLNSLVDVNLERRTVVYEVTLGRDLGIDIVQGTGGGGPGGARVGAVEAGRRAEELGVAVGDLIVATSATAGDSLWVHDNADSIKSALSTRFVMHGNVRLRLERPLLAIPDDVLAVLQVRLGGHLSQDSRSHDIVFHPSLNSTPVSHGHWLLYPFAPNAVLPHSLSHDRNRCRTRPR